MPHFLHDIGDAESFTLSQAHQAVQTLIKQVTERSRDPDSGLPRIVGHDKLIRRLVSAFLIGEHCLLEGLPGLVKTELSKTLAAMLGLVFRRIQFTPDIMPSDLIGRERLGVRDGQTSIEWQHGPVFTNILLADELNRASPKVQSALLEACEERQVTALNRGTERIRPRGDVDEEELVKGSGYFGATLPPERLQHFMVLATMNPIESEGVFPLSEAQVDRFGYKLLVDYPLAEHLRKISEHAFEHPRLQLAHDAIEHKRTLYFLSILREKLLGGKAQQNWMRKNNKLREACETLVNFTHLRRMRRQDDSELGDSAETINEKNEELLAQIAVWSGNLESRKKAQWIQSWRAGDSYPDVQNGSSPRGLLKLIRAVHAEAFLDRAFNEETEAVNPSWKHVAEVAPDVLRHRVRLSSSASALGTGTTVFVNGLLEWLGHEQLAEQLDTLTRNLVHDLPVWCERAKTTTRFLSRAAATGEFRSRRIVARGAERAEPRAFTLEDEPSAIDMGRLPAAAARDFIRPAIDGKLRVVPAIKTVESDFIVVIDLSRSILDGFISRYQQGGSRAHSAKINGLFFAAASFFHLAAGMGFRMRVVYTLGLKCLQDQGGSHQALMLSMLARMRNVLRASRERAEADEDASQRFNLRRAMEFPLSVRTRGVVLVVSDFLDPFASYSAALRSLAVRHHLMLIDVASPGDRRFPVPSRLAITVGYKQVREGARHLEENTRVRPNYKQTILQWNSERKRDHEALMAAARAHGAIYRELEKDVGRGGEAGFLRCYLIAFNHLRELM